MFFFYALNTGLKIYSIIGRELNTTNGYLFMSLNFTNIYPNIKAIRAKFIYQQYFHLIN